jgi:antitoxin MazE
MNMMIAKWGNSLGLRIPSAVAKAVGVEEGTPVRISARKGIITVEPVDDYSLEKLVAGITPENKHDAVETGASVGNEVW